MVALQIGLTDVTDGRQSIVRATEELCECSANHIYPMVEVWGKLYTQHFPLELLVASDFLPVQ